MTIWSLKRTIVLAIATCTMGCQLNPKSSANKYESLEYLQRTQAKVEEALRIEPRTDTAFDQTRLDYDSGPIKPGLHLSAAAVMEQNGQLQGAQEHYQKVLKMEPSNRPALIGVARLHHRAGATDEAIAAYQRAARVLGNDPVILNDLALCLARTNRHDEAIESLRAALVVTPDSLLYRNNLAAVLVQSKRADEAVGVLAETHGLAVAHYNVGYLLNQHGEPAAASAHFVQSLRANPSFQPARTMLDRVLPEVGHRGEERIAEGPPPNTSAAISPVQTSAPPRMMATTPQPSAMPVNLLPNDDHVVTGDVQPAAFTSSVETPPNDHPSAESPVEIAQLPPIRLPASAAPRRGTEGPGGFIAPAPALK